MKFILIILVLIGWTIPLTHRTIVVTNPPTPQILVASFYDYKLTGRWGYTCNRNLEDCYTEHHLTGASRDYPRGTLVEVCRVETKKCVVVKITDWVENEKVAIDLSSMAFQELTGNLGLGLVEVFIKELAP